VLSEEADYLARRNKSEKDLILLQEQDNRFQRKIHIPFLSYRYPSVERGTGTYLHRIKVAQQTTANART
jgi:hypothetical protein